MKAYSRLKFICTFVQMRFFKSCISILLIFCYGLGFAHNLIPHQHNGDHENHEHEHAVSHDDHQHQHINHQDHQDEGLLDFMLCLLIDLEHHEANLEFFKPTQNHFQIDIPTKQIKSIIVEDFCLLETKSDTYQPGIPPDFLFYEFIYQSNSSFRGPPNLA